MSKLTYLKALRGHRIPNGAYRVLIEVFNYTDESGGSAHPGIARLADDCAMGASTVRRHLQWLKDNGYLVQQSRGHNMGEVALASVYSLALPELPLTSERKVEVATAQSEPPTAQFEQSYRSIDADLPLSSEHLSDLSSGPVSDLNTTDPVLDDPHCQDCEDAACNVCPMHFHDREHRYREPLKTPSHHPSGPNTVDIESDGAPTDCFGCGQGDPEKCSVHNSRTGSKPLATV